MMSQFADECEIAAIALKQLVDLCHLKGMPGLVFFLSMKYADTVEPDDPPARLMQLLEDAPVKFRVCSRALLQTREVREVRGATHADRLTGEIGFQVHVGVGKWSAVGSIPVGASVSRGPLAAHGFTAEAFRQDEQWTLGRLSEWFS